jgi:hypothetical protein
MWNEWRHGIATTININITYIRVHTTIPVPLVSGRFHSILILLSQQHDTRYTMIFEYGGSGSVDYDEAVEQW